MGGCSSLLGLGGARWRGNIPETTPASSRTPFALRSVAKDNNNNNNDRLRQRLIETTRRRPVREDRGTSGGSSGQCQWPTTLQGCSTFFSSSFRSSAITRLKGKFLARIIAGRNGVQRATTFGVRVWVGRAAANQQQVSANHRQRAAAARGRLRE